LKSVVAELTRENTLLKENNGNLESKVKSLVSEVENLNLEIESLRTRLNANVVEESNKQEEEVTVTEETNN